jgi:hypothetical protein
MPNLIPIQNETVACRVIGGAAVLVSVEDSNLYWLNPVATRIWELADGQNSLEAIATALCDEFDVNPETALQDTEDMVQAFAAKQLFTTS